MHLDTGAMKEVPVSEYTLERFAQILREHFQDPDNRSFAHFLDEYGVPSTTFRKWLDKSPALHQEYELAKDKVGMQCLLDAAERKYDKDIGKFLATLHSKQIKEHNEYLNSINNKNESSSNQRITLEMPKLVEDNSDKKD